MRDTLDYLRTFAALPFSLQRFASHRLTLEEARNIVRERMERREDNFLHSVQRSIYGHPDSPYLALLKMAGCQLGDMQRLVRQEGVESALLILRREGVYVTFEEFKGRRPIVRGQLTVPVRASDFDNPRMQRAFTIETGGSTGAATSVGVDLEQIADRAPHEMLTLHAHGVLEAPMVRWSMILPAGTLRNILRSARIGQMPVRWFCPVGLRESRYWLKYAVATYYSICFMRLAGLRVPLPEFVPLDRAEIVARCAVDLVRSRGQCLINTTVSRAMRVCLAAREAGLDLRGVTFQGSAEPVTSAKGDFLRDAGVSFLSNYGMVEANRIGAACASPADDGDVHLLKDALALITYPHRIEALDLTVPAFNLTSLLPSASKVMLNVQTDDYGIVEERHCGCELASCGYTTHLRQIRSYSKLVGEGATLLGNEMLDILEKALPARFGGSPLDYQLAEEEDAQGFTRLYLLIHPRVEIGDEGQVVEAVLDALRDSSPMADAARTVWGTSGTIRVRRQAPFLTDRGKLLPLHILRHRSEQPE